MVLVLKRFYAPFDRRIRCL